LEGEGEGDELIDFDRVGLGDGLGETLPPELVELDIMELALRGVPGFDLGVAILPPRGMGELLDRRKSRLV